MNFTENEIKLAKQLKEDGLVWTPKVGDWFHIDGNSHDLFLYKKNNGYIKGYYHSWKDSDCNWLPLFHQCQEILEQANLYFVLFVKDDNVQLDIWSTGYYLGVVRSETLLECMYQAIGLFVLNSEDFRRIYGKS